MIETVSALSSSLRTPTSISSTKMETTETKLTALNGQQGADFGDVLASVTTDAMKTVRQGEAAGIAAIQGKASIQQVVEAVMSAEQPCRPPSPCATRWSPRIKKSAVWRSEESASWRASLSPQPA